MGLPWVYHGFTMGLPWVYHMFLFSILWYASEETAWTSLVLRPTAESVAIEMRISGYHWCRTFKTRHHHASSKNLKRSTSNHTWSSINFILIHDLHLFHEFLFEVLHLWVSTGWTVAGHRVPCPLGAIIRGDDAKKSHPFTNKNEHMTVTKVYKSHVHKSKRGDSCSKTCFFLKKHLDLPTNYPRTKDELPNKNWDVGNSMGDLNNHNGDSMTTRIFSTTQPIQTRSNGWNIHWMGSNNIWFSQYKQANVIQQPFTAPVSWMSTTSGPLKSR